MLVQGLPEKTQKTLLREQLVAVVAVRLPAHILDSHSQVYLDLCLQVILDLTRDEREERGEAESEDTHLDQKWGSAPGNALSTVGPIC